MADGMTKLAVRQSFADKLRRGVHALKYDETFTAGKKLTKAQKAKFENEMNEAAQDFEEANLAEVSASAEEDHDADEPSASRFRSRRAAKIIAKIMAANCPKRFSAAGTDVVKMETEMTAACQAMTVQKVLKVQEDDLGERWLILTMLGATFLAGLLTGVITATKCCKKRQRTMVTMSPVTYKYHYEKPRFKELAERDAGAWPD